MDLPTEEQCLQYFEEFKVPRNIKAHCLKVRDVAVFLARKLNQTGENVNLDFVSRLSLLHDLFKVVTITSIEPNKFHQHIFSEEELQMRKELVEKYPGMHEGEVSHIIFKKDYPQLAIALKDMSDPEKEDKSWEEQIVHYADGRVFQNRIVTLPERFSYLVEAYPDKIALFEKNCIELHDFENKVKEIINLQPEQLANMVGNG